MLVGVVNAAASLDPYGLPSTSPTTAAVVVAVPILLIFLVWLVARRNAQKQLLALKGQQAAAAAEQSARDAFLRDYAGWTDHSYSLFDRSFIAIDAPGRQIALGVVGQAAKYPFEAITAVDVVKDGGVLTLHRDTPRALFLGTPYLEVSALLKAIESPTNTVATVRELALKLTVDDPSTPVYEVNFLHVFADAGLSVTNDQVVAAGRRIDKFHGYIANALRDRQATGSANVKADTADEIKKLWDLKQTGAITDAEYASQKARLLSAGGDAAVASNGET